jgi:hypothetical protein
MVPVQQQMLFQQTPGALLMLGFFLSTWKGMPLKFCYDNNHPYESDLEPGIYTSTWFSLDLEGCLQYPAAYLFYPAFSG